MTRAALMRAVPDAYPRATRADPTANAAPIDLALAHRQHAAVAEGLRRIGLSPVEILPALDGSPDSVFVEDTAVIARGRAVLLRSAHPGRRSERQTIGAALRDRGLEVVDLAAGTADGGDVLRLGDRLYVGRSARTDEAGIASLRHAFADLGLAVVAVALPPGVLHLKCVASSPAPGLVAVADDAIDPTVFREVDVVRIPADEAYAANVIGRHGRVLVAAGYEGAAAALAARGLQPIPVDVSEIRRGDGALTCLSLRFSPREKPPQPG